jgi:hypothetical protein
MTTTRIDVENRVELAARELLAAFANLTALTTAGRVYVKRDTSHAAAYPCATIQAIGFAEFGNRTGWYKGALQLGAMTYRDEDKARTIMKQILGELRGWAQQTDLPAQLNATAIATTAATALQVKDAWIDGGSVDASEDKTQEEFLTVAILCRPSQATTT